MWAFQSASLPPARQQPHLLIPFTQTINQEKTKNPEMKSNFQQILRYCLGLRIQNPRLKGVDLKASPKRGSHKINMQKQGRNTQNKARSLKWIPVLREVDLEPSANRGTNRTGALVSLFWSSWSLHPKQSPKQISHKSNKVDPIRLS